ncbi:tetratricopeptide repeat protein [Sphingomonas canadensis]|uniref:Tetratricopeptide repeat protein n=1 Tax=Sphingomonas canadensis TaxID=1219257 RepID=A0ABW3H5H8_9SPHN|nr:tetratricopeptide repeat protein [Sphingomonas canadensis]MCW3836526.1 tetratricopeptide repeat protein [Sphingomonas canadensis]
MARRSWIALTAGLMLAALPAPAQAEEAFMVGRFPAAYRDAAMLLSLSIDRLHGRDGGALGFAIERALSQPDARGEVHFDLIGGSRRGPGNAEGVLSGAVSSGVEDNYWKRKDKDCAERDANKKCIKEVEKEVDCTRRVINLNADLRITRTTDGRIVYSTSKPLREEQSWCHGAGERPASTVEESITRMINAIAAQVRVEIVPRWERYSIRYRETPKGLPKDLAKRFRASMKTSERNRPGACQEWAAIDAAAPGHPSILFDLGLCAEAAGEYEQALAYYRRADPLIGGRGNEASRGIDRVQRIQAALYDDSERDGRR